MSPPYKALVTGGTGFIGSHLLSRLAAEGCSVDLLTRAGTPRRNSASGVRVHLLDGSTEQLCAVVASSRPDVVFHLASLFLASHEPSQVDPLVRSNVLFGTQLAEAMARSGVSRLVNTGTSWQHFEGRDYSPVNLYAATKAAYEAILSYYVESSGFQVVTLKLFDTYGPGDPRRKLFSLFRDAALSGNRLEMSAGEQLLDLVYIDDVIEAFMVAARRLLEGQSQPNESYAITSGRRLPLRELANTYERVTGRKLPIDWGARPYRPREVMVPWSDGTLLPGWHPQISLEEGIQRMEAADAL